MGQGLSQDRRCFKPGKWNPTFGLVLMAYIHKLSENYFNSRDNSRVTDCSIENPTSMLGIAARMRELIDSEGFQDLPMVVSEHNANFAVNGGNTFPGNIMGAAITAANIIGLTLAKEELKVEGAYIVNGVDGPYHPGNRNSFPLSCKAEYTVNTNNGTMGPSKINFTGTYINNCSYGDALIGAMSINSANGMGLLYSNGDRKPSAVVYEDILSQFLSEYVQPPPVQLPASMAGIYLEKSDGCTKLLLVNADPLNPSPTLPPMSSLMPNSSFEGSGVPQVSQVIQYLRGAPDVILPNQIINFGTVQVQGGVIQRDLGSSGLLNAQGEVELPPSGIVVFNSKCSDENARLTSRSSTYVSSNAIVPLILAVLLILG